MLTLMVALAGDLGVGVNLLPGNSTDGVSQW